MNNGCPNSKYQDKNFNQINYFINKEVLHNQKAIKEIKNEWQKLNANDFIKNNELILDVTSDVEVEI